jgi:hypothetical protein
VNWLASNYYKAALELGHACGYPTKARTSATCSSPAPKFLTTAEYTPVTRAALGGPGWHAPPASRPCPSREQQHEAHDDRDI